MRDASTTDGALIVVARLASFRAKQQAAIAFEVGHHWLSTGVEQITRQRGLSCGSV